MHSWAIWIVRALWIAVLARVFFMPDASWFDFGVVFVTTSCVAAIAEWVVGLFQ